MPRSSRDFSKPEGRRLRVAPFRYDPARRNFNSAKQLRPFLITVEDAAEEKRLWKHIERTIAGGGWRNGANRGSDALPAGSETRV